MNFSKAERGKELVNVAFESFKRQLTEPELLASLKKSANFLARDHSTAEDLVQTTLTKALQHWESFTPGSHLRSWLLTIMKNTFLTSLRKKKEVLRDDFSEAEDPHDAERILNIRAELAEAIEAMSQLSDQHQTVLFLIGIQGMSLEAAAQELNIPIGTVKSRLSRAREMLAHLTARYTSEGS
ncbi:sigma-70 family RNA polymerase sigma factor [Candidatus Parcubacteria bacterium]|nr:sigma-70 family RNA polymerase sigma factor [Candidatus Parcubacteria bacterium]